MKNMTGGLAPDVQTFSALGVTARQERAAAAQRIIAARRTMVPAVDHLRDVEVMALVADELERQAHQRGAA